MNFKKFCMMFLVFCTLLIPVTAYAAGGGGDGKGGGNGSGTGSNSGGLSLTSSTPADGTHDVTLPVQITLTFSNNVVNMTVKDNNLKCFTLSASDGSSIPVDVKMADDQVEPDKKRDVILVPKEELKLNTEYTVTISSELKAKNGDVLGKDVKATFDTGKPASGNTVTSTSSPAPDSTGTGTSNTQSSSTGAADTGAAGNSSLIIVVISAAVVIIAGAAVSLSKRKKHK